MCTKPFAGAGFGRRDARWPLLALLLFSGCLTPFQVQKGRVTASRRVAIVGFTGILALGEDQPRQSLWEAVVGSTTDGDELKVRRQRREAQAAVVYEALRQRLISAFGWDLLFPEAFVSSATLAGLSASPVPQVRQQLPAVAAYASVNSLEPLGLAQLARELDADGLIIAEVRYRSGSSDGFKIAGFGSITQRVVATTHLKMFDAAGALVWEDRDAVGLISTQALSKSALADVDQESAPLIQAAETSFDQLLVRFNDAR